MQQTLMRGTTPTEKPMLAVTERPTAAQLQVWWETMQSDDLSVAYADSFPPTLPDFRREVAQGEKILLLCLVDGQVAGALWLHDLLRRGNGTVSAAWLGGYFLLPYRGRLAIHLWQAARQHWEAAGITHFFSAVNVANRRSQALLTRGMHFHRVGRFPTFTVFHGQPVDVCIYTLLAEDTVLAWELAAARAARQMPSVSGLQASVRCTPGVHAWHIQATPAEPVG
jgi:hypothetical protein